MRVPVTAKFSFHCGRGHESQMELPDIFCGQVEPMHPNDLRSKSYPAMPAETILEPGADAKNRPPQSVVQAPREFGCTHFQIEGFFH